MLRSELSERLEAWATSTMPDAILRDAALRAAPEDEEGDWSFGIAIADW
jgi:hypothetical protein